MFLIDAEILANNLRHYRELRSYTVAELAQRAILQPHVIQLAERAASVPSQTQLRVLADALRISEIDLVMPRPPSPDDFDGC